VFHRWLAKLRPESKQDDQAEQDRSEDRIDDLMAARTRSSFGTTAGLPPDYVRGDLDEGPPRPEGLIRRVGGISASDLPFGPASSAIALSDRDEKGPLMRAFPIGRAFRTST